MTSDLPARRPSIGDDGDAVLAADTTDPILPPWTPRDTLVALMGHGYAEQDADGIAALPPAGIALRARYAEIRGHTAAAARPHGPLTEPSHGEITDARGRAEEAVPLHWP